MSLYEGKADITINKSGDLLIVITPESNKAVNHISEANTYNASVVVVRNNADKENTTPSVMTRIHTA